jgi:hypothetical protein
MHQLEHVSLTVETWIKIRGLKILHAYDVCGLIHSELGFVERLPWMCAPVQIS